MTQVVQLPPSKYKALSSNPSTAKKKKFWNVDKYQMPAPYVYVHVGDGMYVYTHTWFCAKGEKDSHLRKTQKGLLSLSTQVVKKELLYDWCKEDKGAFVLLVASWQYISII
jgi:hypothetical protein